MTVRLRLRALSLRLDTQDQPVGLDLEFRDGLNVIRADNSSGKSTVLQSIVFALGLEGMLSARRDIPLPHSMTDYVDVEGAELPVLRSTVALELENAAGEVITVVRVVKDPVIDRSLVQVTFGPALTQPSGAAYEQRDYFVRRSGAAQREAGFHRFLAAFIGWDLPKVSRMDGSEGLLYLECLFPYFYVEQKHGWSGVQARMPTYLGIRDVAKRSPEYLLGLEVFDRILARQRLRSAASMIETSWQEAIAEYARAAEGAGAVIARVPERISSDFDADSAVPQIFLDNRWVGVDEALAALQAQISQLVNAGTPTVGQDAAGLEQELSEKHALLERVVAAHGAVAEELREYEQRTRQLELRIESLAEDLQRHRDSVVLERLGSSQSVSMLADHVCPTCHQELDDGSTVTAHAMTAAENIKYIEQQLSTFTAMRRDTERVTSALRARRDSLRQTSRQLRSEVRALRDSLTSQNEAPSLATVSQLVSTRLKVERFEERRGDLSAHRERLTQIHASWHDNRTLLRNLSDEGLTDADKRRLIDLENAFRDQLRRYHFSSLPADAVDINRETYRPSHEGFDLGFDISASDMIRVIWAYLIAFMRVGVTDSGNHLGLLMFDEPRQQETARESYEELLQQAAAEGTNGVQIVIATSETSESLQRMMGTAAYTLLDSAPGEKLLRLLP